MNPYDIRYNYAMLCCAMLCYTVLYCTALYHAPRTFRVAALPRSFERCQASPFSHQFSALVAPLYLRAALSLAGKAWIKDTLSQHKKGLS